MGSSRLPGKVLKDIAGRPLLGHVVGRLKQLSITATVVVATSGLEHDDAIANWCVAQNVTLYRGDELDVLDRYLRCAETFGFTDIVRLTADNPFTDIEELEQLITLHVEKQFDYTHSFGQLPIGVGAEILTRESLGRAHADGLAPHHREHVNEYIIEHPELFNSGILNSPAAKCCPALRLTVDTPEDYRIACLLAANAKGQWLNTEEAISLCSASA